MKIKLNVMYLNSRSGNTDDGKIYYQGVFLEKSSNQTFKLYYNEPDKLKAMQPYKDYDIDCELYINNKGLWSIKAV